MAQAVDDGAAPAAEFEETHARDRIPIRTKLLFGVGSGAETISMFGISYAILFYNQILGLPAHLAGLAASVSLIIDGLGDPLVGSISDRTNSRFGRRHIFMLLAPIPMGFSLVAMFNPPPGMGHIGLFIWFAATIALLRLVQTFYQVPHLAFGGELSRDYTERSRVMSYYQFFNWAGGAIASWVALSYFFKATPEYPRGLLNPEPWTAFSISAAAFGTVLLLVSAIFTLDRVKFLPKPPRDQAKFTPFEFLKDVSKALANRNYLWLLIAFFFMSLLVGIRAALHLYTNIFYWELTSEQIRWFVLGSLTGYVAGFLLTARIHKRFGKRNTMIFAATFYVVGPAIPVALGGLGYLTPSTPGLLQILVALSAVGFAAASINAITIASALADIADENELKYGVRQEGVIYSTRSLFSKIDVAIGTALAGAVLTWIGFPTKAQVGEVAPDIVWQLAMWDGLVCCVPGLIAVFFYAKFGISRKLHAETRAALAERARLADELGQAE